MDDSPAMLSLQQLNGTIIHWSPAAVMKAGTDMKEKVEEGLRARTQNGRAET